MASAIALSTLSPSIAGARDVIGHGARSCGAWMEDQRDEYLALIDEAWVAGYLSGYNLTADDGVDLPDRSGAHAWITKYCRTHPLDGIWKASGELVNELTRRASH
jgi:hypothetical protein